jgi:hypothetical protein
MPTIHSQLDAVLKKYPEVTKQLFNLYINGGDDGMSTEDCALIIVLLNQEAQELCWEFAGKIALEMAFWIRHKDFPVKVKLSKAVMLYIAMRHMVCMPMFSTEEPKE